jgi:hypothetical protein
MTTICGQQTEAARNDVWASCIYFKGGLRDDESVKPFYDYKIDYKNDYKNDYKKGQRGGMTTVAPLTNNQLRR